MNNPVQQPESAPDSNPAPTPPPLSLRERWRDIIFEADTRAGKIFDVALLAVIGLSIAVVMMESVAAIREKHYAFLHGAEWVFTIAFTIEYGLRIWTSDDPKRYVFSFFGLVDLLSILPTYVSIFFIEDTHYLAVIRILRMLRMFRILKMMRHMREGDVILRALISSRAKITVFVLGVVSLVMITGTFMYLIEGAENGFTSIPVSIYWAIVTVTTVGYGDISPTTPFGQLLAACMMIVGYAIIAVPTGIVGIELARELNQHPSKAKCPTCGARGHHDESNYCYRCGESLEEE